MENREIWRTNFYLYIFCFELIYKIFHRPKLSGIWQQEELNNPFQASVWSLSSVMKEEGVQLGTEASCSPVPELTCFIYDHYFPSTFLWEKKMQKLKFINSKHPHLKENVSNIFLE